MFTFDSVARRSGLHPDWLTPAFRDQPVEISGKLASVDHIYSGKRMIEKGVYCAIDQVIPVADKQSRAQSIQARMTTGKVRFPSFPRWYGDSIAP